MRQINLLVIHCSATKENQLLTIQALETSASAQIVCTGDCQVTFYLMGEANEGMAEYMLTVIITVTPVHSATMSP